MLTGLVLAAAAFAAGPASAQEGYEDGRIRFVEPGVTLQRATEAAAEEATANLPFLPGDRVWTDATGRAEFQFPDGSVVRLDSESKLDYAGHDQGTGNDERVLSSGCARALSPASRSRPLRGSLGCSSRASCGSTPETARPV
jgi:hypothetical protein